MDIMYYERVKPCPIVPYPAVIIPLAYELETDVSYHSATNKAIIVMKQ